MTFAALATTATLILTPLAAQEASEARPAPVHVSLIAVQATYRGHQERKFDDSIVSIRETVEDLKQFDDFRKLREAKTVVTYGEETKIPLDSRYTLFLKPIEQASHDRIRCDVRVHMRVEEQEKKPDGASGEQSAEPKYKEVLRCTLVAVSEKPFKVGGLKLDEGQLVLILTLRNADPANNG
ncbi:MAG TPA: hypothetical protein PKY01_01045 [Candidatus Hydrogenedentes bacterium]|mgnify:FL=1|nr:hypothetical protein [Candidatus Hydrogenedentota bacterium]HQH50978.1 hypothetical protein [Candidatus Hydrogenedentota bacterium]HQM51342.1 hypothetical protein [Candidatus Hydrogenedentota bacterium]